MATYYISPSGNDSTGNGSNGNPWRTLAKAHASAANGDTIICKNGTYTGSGNCYGVTISKALTIQAESQWGAIFDGEWPPSLWTQGHTMASFRLAWPQRPHLNMGIWAHFWTLAGSNITVDGVVICNSQCRGIVIDSLSSGANRHNITIQNCRFDWTLAASFTVLHPLRKPETINNLRVLNNVFTRYSNDKYYHTWDRNPTSDTIVPTINALQVCGGTNCTVAGNIFAYGHGEVTDRQGTIGYQAYDNIMFCVKDAWYVGRSHGARVHRNIMIGWPNGPQSPYPQTRFACRTETGSEGTSWNFINSDIAIFNNLLVGVGMRISNQHQHQGSQWFTDVDRIYFGHNTMVATANMIHHCLAIETNSEGKARGIIENNIIDGSRNAANAKITVGNYTQELTFRNNLWTSDSPSSSRGPGTVIASSAGLVNAAASLNPPNIAANTSLTQMNSIVSAFVAEINSKLGNYLPRSDSPAVNAGSTGGSANNTQVPTLVRQQDLRKAARVGVPDMGAIEFGGTVSPTNSVTAVLSASPLTGAAPLAVTFNSSGSITTGSATINSREWNFGDGTTSTATNPTKTYDNPGNYQVVLTVRDTTLGLVSTATTTITVTSGTTYAMNAAMSQTNLNGTPATGGPAPYTVIFRNTSQPEGGAQITRTAFHYSATEGEFVVVPAENGLEYVHVYGTPGTYTPHIFSVDASVSPVVREQAMGTAIVVTEPDSGEVFLAADFTMKVDDVEVTSGEAPLVVEFEDMSTAANTSVAHREWLVNLGGALGETAVFSINDSSPVMNIDTPGFYAFTLRVANDDYSAQAETTKYLLVLAGTGGGGGTAQVIVDAVRVAAPTSTGSPLEFTFALDDNNPKLALLFMTLATSAGSNANGAMFAAGIVTADAQAAQAGWSENNAGASNTTSGLRDDAALIAVSGTSVVGKLSFNSFAPNKLILNVDTAFAAGYLITAVAIAGPQAERFYKKFSPGSVGNSTGLGGSLTEPLLFSMWMHSRSASSTGGQMNYGFGLADLKSGGGVYNLSHRDRSDMDPTDIYAALMGGTDGTSVLQKRTIHGARLELNKSTKSVTVRDTTWQGDTMWAQIGLPADVERSVTVHASPTSTGNQSYDIGFQPQALIMLVSTLPDVNTFYNSAAAEGWALVVVDGGATYSLSVASLHAAATTKTRSRAADVLSVLDGDGNVELAGTVSLDTDGFDINWTTVQGTARRFVVLAIGESGTVGGGDEPVAYFDGWPRRTTTGFVDFIDLSNGNGETITDWLWDFGDGTTSTEQDPTHRYGEFGTYTVSLTVTTSEGSSTVTRESFITFVDESGLRVTRRPVGPIDPLPITLDSEDRILSNPDNEEEDFYHTHSLHLDGLRFSESPPDNTIVYAGEVTIFTDEPGWLRVNMSNGAVWYIELKASKT